MYLLAYLVVEILLFSTNQLLLVLPYIKIPLNATLVHSQCNVGIMDDSLFYTAAAKSICRFT